MRPLAWLRCRRDAAPDAVVVRHRPTGRFLAGAGETAADVTNAFAFDDADQARAVLRYACEPEAFTIERLADAARAEPAA